MYAAELRERLQMSQISLEDSKIEPAMTEGERRVKTLQELLAKGAEDFEGMRHIFLEVLACAKDLILQARSPEEAQQGYDQMVSVMDLSLSLFKDLIPAESKSVRSIGTQAGGLR